MRPLKLTPQQLDQALGLEPMLTLTQLKEQAEELRLLLHKHRTTRIADGPTLDEIDSHLADVEDACNDDCDSCHEMDRAARRLFTAVRAASEGKPDREELQAALSGLLFLTGVFNGGEALSALSLITAAISDPVPTTEVPPCAASMGCLCAGHARGNPADAACDTSENPTRRRR